jgi:lysophospholipase L1-like esterase
MLRATGIAGLLTVLVLGIVELLVRALGLAPALPPQWIHYSTSPYLVWGPAPNSGYEGVLPSGEFRYSARHNSLGLRDVERAFEKPPGTFRILGLGDSFTYGWGAEFEQTYLYRLEQALNARPGHGAEIEVIKAGVARFFPEPERILLERLGTKFRPDLVVVGFVANDVVDTCMGMDAIAVGPNGELLSRPSAALGSVGPWLYENSHAARIVLSAWVNYNFLRRCEFGPRVYAPTGAYEESWRKIEAEYARMAAIAKDIGARMVIVNIPDQPPWNEAHEYPGQRLGAWAAAHGVAFLDLLPAMKAAATRKQLYWKTDPHCTPAGYAVIAGELAGFLEASGLVP